MSFDKQYKNRKDQRKGYYKKSSRHFASCRPGGSCPYCKSNREHSNKVREQKADESRKESLE